MSVQSDPETADLDARALGECMTVAREAPGLYSVTTASGREYVVEPTLGACECPDHRYRDRTCKHLRRVEFVTGQRAIPGWANRDAVDPVLFQRREVLGDD